MSAVAKTPKYRKIIDLINPDEDVGLTTLDPQLPLIQMNNLHGGLSTTGAPIFDSKGRVLGIASFVLNGFDFAVHFSRCEKFLQDYLADEGKKKKKTNKKRKRKSGHQMDLVP